LLSGCVLHGSGSQTQLTIFNELILPSKWSSHKTPCMQNATYSVWLASNVCQTLDAYTHINNPNICIQTLLLPNITMTTLLTHLHAHQFCIFMHTNMLLQQMHFLVVFSFHFLPFLFQGGGIPISQSTHVLSALLFIYSFKTSSHKNRVILSVGQSGSSDCECSTHPIRVPLTLMTQSDPPCCMDNCELGSSCTVPSTTQFLY